MLQRKASKPGEGLGKTTGWIHRATPVVARREDDPGGQLPEDRRRGLHVLIGGEPQLLRVDQHDFMCRAGAEARSGRSAA
jgi:2,4-dienoyl-CoA reductase (NADPH2)